VPTMALEITGLVVPIALVLGLEKLVSSTTVDIKKLQLAAYIIGTVFVMAATVYFTSDYSIENKKRTVAMTQLMSGGANANMRAAMDSIERQYPAEIDNHVYESFLYQSKGDAATAKGLLTALRQDRQSAFGSTIVRSLIFVLLAMGIIYLFVIKKIKAVVMLAGVGLLTVIDLLGMDSNYLNSFSFGSKDNYEASEFPLTAADQAILQDKDPNFRVLNMTVRDPYAGDSRTSYYHKSIGGYHPARLGIYDDLMEYQLSGSPNINVINMLNTKYVIQQTQQGGAPMAVPNPNALGNVWFVKNVKYVAGPVEEMKALNSFNPAEEAVVDNSFKSKTEGWQPADSSSTIKQTAFDFENVKYESNSSAPHLAVFSEIFYKDWHAYIDGKETPIAKADYVLRTMLIPAGKHTIEFKFEPSVYKTGYTISSITGWLLTLLVLGYIVLLVKPMLKK